MGKDKGPRSNTSTAGIDKDLEMAIAASLKESGAPSLPKVKTLRAAVWNEYERFKDDLDRWRARCKHCSCEFAGDPSKNGTSTLTKHINVGCKKRSRVDSNQTQLSMTKSDVGDDAISSWRYDPLVARKRLAEMIICDELPFKHVDGWGFRRFVASLNPRFNIPSHFTVQRDCLEIYREEKDKLMLYLKTTKQRVCITTDTWTSVQQINYMVITVHYIDANWNLCKKLLSFSPIKSHRGIDLASAIEKVFRAWGVHKIFTITVDNASSNDTAIRQLKEEYGSKEGSVLGGEYMHMRCMAHILNLACIDGLKIKDAPVSIRRIRQAVRYVKHSLARLQLYKDCMVMEGDQSKVQLALDVKTRWNSTYYMLNAALKHEKVWKRFDKEDKFFSVEMSSAFHDSVGLLEASDWDYIRKLHGFLEYFYEVTLKISGSKYVTANIFYHEIIGLFSTLKRWIENVDDDISSTARKMKEKLTKYWVDPEKINMLIFVAAILDPRYKLKFIDFTMHFLHDDREVANKMKLKAKETVYKFFAHYKDEVTPSGIGDSMSESSSTVTSSSTSTISATNNVAMMEIYQMFDGENGQGVQSDLDIYLAEGNVPVNTHNSPPFDVLNWWKGNAVRFPILSQMARDVLAVPISTVASESAFSTGGRVLDDFRSSLAPVMVEVLLCSQDWLRGSFHSIGREESLDEQDNISFVIAPSGSLSQLPTINETIEIDEDKENED